MGRKYDPNLLPFQSLSSFRKVYDSSASIRVFREYREEAGKEFIHDVSSGSNGYTYLNTIKTILNDTGYYDIADMFEQYKDKLNFYLNSKNYLAAYCEIDLTAGAIMLKYIPKRLNIFALSIFGPYNRSDSITTYVHDEARFKIVLLLLLEHSSFLPVFFKQAIFYADSIGNWKFAYSERSGKFKLIDAIMEDAFNNKDKYIPLIRKMIDYYRHCLHGMKYKPNPDIYYFVRTGSEYPYVKLVRDTEKSPKYIKYNKQLQGGI